MTLSRALGNAYSGLSNSAFRADITASNIANATTPGYVRRSTVSAENVVGGFGNGVRTVGVDRHQDVGLTRLRRETDGSAGRADILSNAYGLIDRELGVPGESDSLFSGFTAVETSLRELATTPEYKQIGASVQTVNDALHRLKGINTDILGRAAGSVETVGLEDERQRLMDTIAEIIPIKDIPRDGGQVDILTENGVVLLAGNVNELEFRTTSNKTCRRAGHIYGCRRRL